MMNNPLFLAATGVLFVFVIRRWRKKVYRSYLVESPVIGTVAWIRNRIFVLVRDRWDWPKSAATLTFLAVWSYSNPDHHVIPAFVLILCRQLLIGLTDGAQRFLTLGENLYSWFDVRQSVTVLTFGYLFWLKRLPSDWAFWSEYSTLSVDNLFTLGSIAGFC